MFHSRCLPLFWTWHSVGRCKEVPLAMHLGRIHQCWGPKGSSGAAQGQPAEFPIPPYAIEMVVVSIIVASAAQLFGVLCSTSQLFTRLPLTPNHAAQLFTRFFRPTQIQKYMFHKLHDFFHGFLHIANPKFKCLFTNGWFWDFVNPHKISADSDNFYFSEPMLLFEFKFYILQNSTIVA